MRTLKTLLLNSSFEVLNFIPERRVFRLIFNGKAEVISEWDEPVIYGREKINHPAIIRLKRHVKRNYFNSNFSRKALIKRDKSFCQYCLKKLTGSQITIDHVVPKAQRGVTSFTNCVVSCHTCNNKKADRTPEQAGMTLIRKPTHPSFRVNTLNMDVQEYWHDDWDGFLSRV